MRCFYKFIIGIAILAMLTGCAVLVPNEAPGTATIEPVLEPTQTPIPIDPLLESQEEIQCAYVWASRPLPEFTDLLQAGYRSAGIEDVQADVSAYGENCVDPETKQIIRFLIMRSEFYFSVTSDDLENKEDLARQLMRIMTVLQKFPPETFPGPQPSTVIVRFESGEEASILSFRMDEFDQVLEEGLRGAALYEALD